jgi:predicted transcriptional regulator
MKTQTQAMTLRLDPNLADDLETVAFDLRMSKADFLRRSLYRALEHARQHELPLLTDQVREALQIR